MLKKKNTSSVRNSGQYFEPFCFVRFNDKVMQSQFSYDSIPDSMEIKKGLLSGVITYSVNALSPIILHDIENDAIPASSIRGLIRENLQILSFSSIREDIEDRHLFYRGINPRSNMYKEYQSRIGAITATPGDNQSPFFPRKYYQNIKAGIIENKSGGYYIRYSNNVIEKAEPEPTYYPINLMRLQQNDKNWRQFFKVKGIDNKNVFDCLGSTNFTSRRRVQRKNIKPFFKKVAFSLNNSGQIEYVLDIDSALAGSREGYLLSSGMVMEQHTFYLIPIPTSNVARKRIDNHEINNYLREGRNHTDKSNNNFYNLPRKNSEKPVFFIEEGENIRFGFTLLFPLADQKGLQERINSENFTGLDYSMALFGYKKDGIVYPGRLSFSDLTLSSLAETEPSLKKIGWYLASPKPQGFNIYFDSDLYCKGTKMYWLREEELSMETTKETLIRERNQKEVKYFPVNCILGGSIRFFNLTKEELGLLLWSIELNTDSEQLIGGYKAFGYGRVKITISSCKCYDDSSYYMMPTHFFTNMINVGAHTRTKYVRLYQEHLNEFLNGKISENIRLKEFFFTKKIRSEVVRKIIPYSEWRMTRQMQMEEITMYAKNTTWVVLDKDQTKEVLKHILWDDFIHNPPDELASLQIYQEIIERYQELVALLEAFKRESNYYVRKDILETVSQLSDFSIAAIKNIVNEHKTVNALSGYAEALEYIDRCLNEIETISNNFEDIYAEFSKETVPTLNVEGRKNKDIITLVISNGQNCRTAFVNTIKLSCGNEILKFKRFLRIQGDTSATFEIQLKKEQIELLERYKTFDIKITFKYLNKNGFQLADATGIVSYYNYERAKVVLKNPYAAYVKGGPVIGNKMFFGRTELIQEVISYLEEGDRDDISGQICILYGQQRSGKSSVLEHIKQELYNKSNTNVVASIGNIGAIESSENDLLGEIALCITHEINIEDIDTKLLEKQCIEILASETPRREFAGFMRRVVDTIGGRKKIILLIDEFTYLYAWIEAGYIRRDFIRFWKAFTQNYNVSSVIVGQDFMPDFISDYKNEFGTSKTIRVSYLEKEHAIKLIQVPFLEHNLFNPYTDDAINKIIELTAGSAFYIMIICNALVTYVENNSLQTINAVTVMTVVNDYLLNEGSNNRLDMDIFDPLIYDGYYSEYVNDNVLILRIVSSLEKNGWCSYDELIKYCKKIGIEDFRHKIDRLEKREVVSLKEGKEVAIRVKLFKEFLMKKYGGMDI